MNLSFFIARRMAHSTAGHKPGVMERISVISVALGVAVMILTLAVILGFKHDVAYKMSGMAAHVTLTDIGSVHAPGSSPIRRSQHVEELIRSTEGFRSAAPFAVKGGILRTDEAVGEVLLKGVGAEYDWQFYREWLVEGELPRVSDSVRTKDLLLSRTLAQRLQLHVGDRIELLFVDAGDQPRRDRFKVCGIYASGMDEMDNTIVVTDLRNVQRLAEWTSDQISGYEIQTDNLSTAGDFARRLSRTLLYDESDESSNLIAESIADRYPNIFDWLRAHDVNAAVVIAIMLIVAFFNLTTALLILVLERIRMIGLLKTFGMPNRQLRSIFLWRAAFITARGLAWGNLIGIGLCLLQQHFHLLRLSSEGYLLSEVPIALHAGWLLLLNAGFIAMILVLLITPTYIISTVRPDETIRYE